jgi:hypothetical protein
MKKLLIIAFVLSFTIQACKTKLEKIQVDCSQLETLLAEVYKSDQSVRQEKDMTKIDFELMNKVDLTNLGKVVSIIEQCGMPNSQIIGKENLNTIFLVIQHSGLNYQKEYFPMLKELADNGDLDWSSLAMLEDRILMGDGKPQVYGTQIQSAMNSNDYELYELENPEYVDKRRKKVGMEPLSEYLKYWDLEFKVEQKK